MSKIFLGEPPANIKAWIVEHYAPAPSELEIPLYFRGNEPGASISMLAWDDDTYELTSLQCHLQYSTDGMSTWAAYDGSIVYLDDCTDNKVYFRADPMNPNTDGFYVNYIYHYFKTDKSIAAGGNIQFLLESTGTRTDVPEYGFLYMFSGLYEEHSCASLMTAPLLPATRLAGSCYRNMFYGCTSLVLAPALPATTLADNCYESMFSDCTSLVQAPLLPATTLADYCYSGMFSGCTSLVLAPALPATTLAHGCCSSMFYGCTSLVQAPALPATTLISGCYNYMFSGCTSLVLAPALPATTLAGSCYRNMFYGCTHLASMDVSFTAWNPSSATTGWVANAGSEATGTKTFTCPSGLSTTTRGSSFIPHEWTIVTK